MTDDTGIRIDKDAMQALVLKAILDSWTPEQRDKLVADAMAFLLNEKNNPNSWQDKETVLQAIMKNSVRVAAEQVVRELIRDKYENILVPMIDEHLANLSELININDVLAEAISEGIKKKRGY